MRSLLKILIILCFFTNALLLNAQTSTEKWDQYSEIAFTNYENKKFVDKILVNEKGFATHSALIESIVKKAKDSKTYLIRVKKKGKFGWANVSGELIIPIEYDGGTFGSMPNGLICAKKSEKWGFIDFKNNIVAPFVYDNIAPFKDGYSQVTSNGKMGFVNTAGVEIIKPVYNKVEPFLNGAAVVMKDNKYGFINTKGAILGAISYDGAFSFDEYKFGYIKMGTKYGIIDSTGNLLFSDEFTKAPKALNSSLFSVEKNSKCGVMNKAGKLLMDYKYERIYSPRADASTSNKESDIILRVYYGTRYGFVKVDGTVVSECVFSSAGDVYMGQAQVEMTDDAMTKFGTFYTDTKEFRVDREAAVVVVEIPDDSRGRSTTKKSGASEKQFCLILNDLTQAQLDGKNTVKLGFTGFKMATTFIPRGKTLEVDCDDVWVYKLKNQNSSERVKGYDLFNTKGKCGQTIKLSDYW